MRELLNTVMLVAAVLCACACGSGSEPVAPPAAQTPPAGSPTSPPAVTAAGDKVTLAVSIAREIADDPEHSAQILGRHGITDRQYEALMLEIASDPDLSRRYSSEMER